MFRELGLLKREAASKLVESCGALVQQSLTKHEAAQVKRQSATKTKRNCTYFCVFLVLVHIPGIPLPNHPLAKEPC